MLDDEELYGQALLSRAASMGHKEVVKLLLDKGVGAVPEDYFGRGQARAAVLAGYADIVNLLLKGGAETDANEALFKTSEKRHMSMVKLLLGRDAKSHLGTMSHIKPLSLATERGHKDLVKLLLENGADINSKNISGQRALDPAAHERHRATFELFLQRGAKSTQRLQAIVLRHYHLLLEDDARGHVMKFARTVKI